MAELARPGVEIQQVVATTSPTILQPALMPCLVAPCNRIVDAFTSSGAVNTLARAGAYTNGVGTVAYSFPQFTYGTGSDLMHGNEARAWIESGSSTAELNSAADEVVVQAGAGGWSYLTGSRTLTLVGALADSLGMAAGDVVRLTTVGDDGPVANGTDALDVVIVSITSETAVVIRTIDDWGHDVAGGASQAGWKLIKNPAEFMVHTGAAIGSTRRITTNAAISSTTTNRGVDITAVTAGSAGDAITVTFDSTASAIAVARSGNAITVDYVGTTSTWAQIKAAWDATSIDEDLATFTVLGTGGDAVPAVADLRSTNGGTGATYSLDGGADSGTLVVDEDLLATKFSIASTALSGFILMQYTALRRDVTNAGATPALLRFDSETAMVASIGPVDTRNPLALMFSMALKNSPGKTVSGIGIDEQSPQFPEGTVAAYTRAFTFLASKEVYAIAPFSQSSAVHQVLKTHVTAMSASTEKHERIGIVSRPLVTNQADTVLGSGTTTGDITVGGNFTSGDNFTTMAVTAGDVLVIASEAGPFALGNGLTGWRVASISGDTTIALNATDVSSQAPTANSSATWTIYRPGATATSNLQEAEAVAAYSSGLGTRRMVQVLAPQVTVTVGGSQQLVSGAFACAAFAGQIGGIDVQKPHTNLTLTGLDAVKNTGDRYSTSELDTIAGGGTTILVQDLPSGPVIVRHQLTTDVSTIEYRELSITKVLDYLSKFFRNTLKPFIGQFNITGGYMDTMGTLIEGQRSALIARGTISNLTINSLIQSTTQPDTVEIDLSVAVYYPANYIRVKLII